MFLGVEKGCIGGTYGLKKNKNIFLFIASQAYFIYETFHSIFYHEKSVKTEN